MKTLRILYHLALADILERTRRYSFLLVLGVVIFLGVLVNNGTMLVQVMSNDPSLWYKIVYRGEFNSAWIGSMTALLINTFLGFLGFYLVSDCIKRDIRTGVGQIIATTPVSRVSYLIGKWISNFAVLAVMVLIMAVAAAIMVLIQGEAALEPGRLLMPLLVIALPLMVLVAALAVVFDTIPWLRGAVGNIVYFFMGMGLLSITMVYAKDLPFRIDPMGYNLLSDSIAAQAQATFPNQTANGISTGFALPSVLYKIFDWPGLNWTPGIIAGQWLWAVIGLGLILLSAIWFARFDPSREGGRHTPAKSEVAREGKQHWLRKIMPHISLPSLSPLISKLAQLNPFLGVLFAELRLLLNGRRWWWWLVIIGLNIGIVSDPLSETTQGYLIPITWLWPLAIWSEMGNRERKNNTSQMVFSSARPVLRQLPAAWLAGVLVTTLFSAGMGVVSFQTGGLPGLIGWAGGVIFVPSLALALGVFSSGNRIFEVIYILLWYMGPLEKMPGMNFTADMPQFYLLAAAGLLLLSAFWRGRQVRV
jgi:hypothetical protein